MARTITVQAGDKLQAGEIALWEVNSDHPDGEVMIAKVHPGETERSYKVARTPMVNQRLSDGRLMEATEKVEPAPAASALLAPVAPADPLAFLTDEQRKHLADAGIVTADDVRRVSDDDLKIVEGIGPATVTRLREATKEG